MKSAIPYVFIALLLSSFSYAQTIPASRRVDWTYAGLQRPAPVFSTTANITLFGGLGNGVTANDAALQAAITSLGTDSGTIYFPPGNFLFTTKITLRSGIVLRGAGSASTTLTFNLGGVDDCINVVGSSTSTITDVTQSITKGQDYVVVADPSLFSVNDYVKLTFNDSSIVFDSYKTVGQILRIKQITGNTLQFYSPLRRYYDVSKAPQLRKLLPMTSVGIECLKIKRVDATAAQKANIIFKYAAQCWVTGVESDSANFSHISFDNSTNMEMTGCFIHGAFGYGGGGQGYGVSTHYGSGECLVENNIFRHLRHSIIVQLGANGNVYAFNYSREPNKTDGFPADYVGDIVLHGNYPYANLFEGNVVQNIFVDVSHGINGPFNTFFRNRVQSYGLVMSGNSGDSTNVVGNEITGTGFGKGTYAPSGAGNYEYGNNVKGTITPAGATVLNENSYYYSSEPGYWTMATQWPGIGMPNPYNTLNIPAAARFVSGLANTVCGLDILANDVVVLTGENRGVINHLACVVETSSDTRKLQVERSADGRLFTAIGEIRIIAGKRNYSFDDKEPLTTSYYRLKLVLASGEVKYSTIITLKSANTSQLTVYPNPATDRVYIKAPSAGHITIRNSHGQLVFSREIPSSLNTQIDVSEWAKGIYFIEASGALTGRKLSSRFIKE